MTVPVHEFPAAIRAETAEPDAEVDLRLDEDEPLDQTQGPDDDPDAGATVLDDLRGELRKKASLGETPRWTVETRPGWEVTYSLDVSQKVFNAALREATPKNRAQRRGGRAEDLDLSKADEVTTVSLFLARYNTGIYRRGARQMVAPGRPLTFREPALMELLEMDPKTGTASECIRRFYGAWGDEPSDGTLLNHGQSLLDLTGLTRPGARAGEDTGEEDPTS